MSVVISGLNAWMLQRVSALYLLIFVLVMPMWVIVYENIDSLTAWQAFMSSPPVIVSFLLFFASLFSHAWVGIRDVVIDYIHPFALRVFLLSVVALYLFAMMLWVLRVLLLYTGVLS